MRGITRPFLAEASDGHLYVVKWESDECTSSMLFNEAAGTILYQAIGLTSPAWKPIFITESFIEDVLRNAPENFGDESLRAGVAFGSQFLGESGRPLLEILSGTSFALIRDRRSLLRSWLVDICAFHTDNRQIVFIRDDERRLIANFIDHGHMFGGREGKRIPHFVACRYLDPRIYPAVSIEDIEIFVSDISRIETDVLRSSVASMPEEWKSPSRMRVFTDCLDRLQDATLVQGLAGRVVDALERGKRHGRSEPLTSDQSTAEILPPVVSQDSKRTVLAGSFSPHCARFVQ